MLCHVVFTFKAKSMLVSGGFASLRFVFAQRDCLAAPMVCQGVGVGLPGDCPGIGKGFMAESVWVFCRECVFSL